MQKVKSKIDQQTTYIVTVKDITVSRGGDSLTIAFDNLEETIRVFRKDIQEEILSMRNKKKEQRCGVCNNLFSPRGNQKYCSKECSRLANIETSRQWRANNKVKVEEKSQTKRRSNLAELNRQAKDMGLTYGQLQAMRYKESMRW